MTINSLFELFLYLASYSFHHNKFTIINELFYILIDQTFDMMQYVQFTAASHCCGSISKKILTVMQLWQFFFLLALCLKNIEMKTLNSWLVALSPPALCQLHHCTVCNLYTTLDLMYTEWRCRYLYICRPCPAAAVKMQISLQRINEVHLILSSNNSCSNIKVWR